MIKALIFDLDDTLYEYQALNREATESLADIAYRRLGVSRDAFFAAYSRARDDTKAPLSGTAAGHNRLLYCQKTLENLGHLPVPLALEMYEAYWGYILGHMVLRQGAADLFRYCREKGIKTGICTDLTAHIQHRKLRALGLAEWVDVLVTSEEAGAEKPSPRIYRLVLDKLGTEAGDVMFIGDSYEKDVEGPRAAGMRAVWFPGKETCRKCRDQVSPEPDTVTSMDGIRRLLDADQQD